MGTNRSDHSPHSPTEIRVLLSMTGFGEARIQSDELTLGVEVRAVNNRHLKVTVRGSEPYPMLEPELEKVIRKHVRRGTILVHIRCDRNYRPQDFRINEAALKAYIQQVHDVCSDLGWGDRAHHLLSQALTLPGVAPEPGVLGRPPDAEMAAVEKALESALKSLDRMRQEEGRAMADELLTHRRMIADQLERIRLHIPSVGEQYRARLRERISHLLREANVAVNDDNLLREVALFAERSDVAEEVMRLGSHLDQFADVVKSDTDGPGRKLEFLAQEMFRETNTIGSKAGDVVISRHVVEIKSALERVRELVQNVE
jgi:uncharacterized protein (TIGR00255 family)